MTLCLLAAAWACRPFEIKDHPEAGGISNLQGYASVSFSGDFGKGRSRFSFLFVFPGKGRIDASDMIGRTVFRILILGENSYFILPAERIFWQGSEQEIIQRFLGVGLEMKEMVALITGDWGKAKDSAGERVLWTFTYDKEGRIISGTRGELSFTVEAFIKNSSFSKTVRFFHESGGGRIKILGLEVDNDWESALFDTGFLTSYSRKTWEEIAGILDNED